MSSINISGLVKAYNSLAKGLERADQSRDDDMLRDAIQR